MDEYAGHSRCMGSGPRALLGKTYPAVNKEAEEVRSA